MFCTNEGNERLVDLCLGKVGRFDNVGDCAVHPDWSAERGKAEMGQKC